MRDSLYRKYREDKLFHIESGTGREYMEEHLIRLTSYMIRELFHNNIAGISTLFHPDITYEEGMKGRFVKAKKQVTNALKDTQMLESTINECQFQVVAKGKDIVVITGSYIRIIEMEQREILRRHQHMSVAWRRGKENWSICYLYLPGFTERQRSEPEFSQEISKELCEKVIESMHSKSVEERTLIALGPNGGKYLIKEKNIRYIEAQGKQSLVCSVERSVEVQEGIGKLEAKLGEGFVKIHRSYIVNCRHVSEIKRFWIVMDNGTKLPVPEGRYTQVKSTLFHLKGSGSCRITGDPCHGTWLRGSR